MSYIIECLGTNTIEEAVSGSGIQIINDTTLTVGNILTIADTTAAGAGTGALVVAGGISVGSALGGAGGDAIDANGANIRNGPTMLTDFPNDSDYITKGAVQQLATGIMVLGASKIATIAAINTFVTPTTGADVITSNALRDINTDVNGAGGDDLFDVPTTPLIIGDRILVKNDARSAPNGDVINGIYEVTVVGVAAVTAWELTRVAEMNAGDNAFQAYTLVTQGATEQGGYIQTNGSPTTVGTDPLNWDLFILPVSQNLEQVLSIGNLTGANTIVIDTGSGGILSTAGTNLTVDAGTDDLILDGNNVAITSTLNTTINAVDVTTTATGNLLDTVTGTSTTNAAGITLASTAALTASGTTASLTANTGDLTLTSTAGTVNINDAVGGVSIDTGANTVTVNTGDVVITAPLPQDIVGALNALQASVIANVPQRVSYQLATINIRTNNAFPSGATPKPIYWTWDESRYGAAGMNYQLPVLVFEVVSFSADVHVRNDTAAVDMLATAPFAVGFHAQALSPVPTADAEIWIEFRSTVANNRANIRGVALEWRALNAA